MSKKRKHVDDHSEPTEKLNSDGDILIKDLLEKQLSKETSLFAELTRKNEYVSKTETSELDAFVPGKNSLTLFQGRTKYLEEVNNLRSIGLSNQDILLYIDNKEKGVKYLEVKHKNLDPTYLRQKLDDICDLIYNKNLCKDVHPCTIKTDRQKTEFMLSVKPNSTETALLKFALENKKTIDQAPSSMSIVKKLEEDMMKSLKYDKMPNISKIQKKARKIKNRIELIKFEPYAMNTSTFESLKTTKIKSNWDKKEPQCNTGFKQDHNQKLFTCENKLSDNVYTVKDGTIIKINKPLDSANTYLPIRKLSVEEIKQIPKLASYHPGTPSKMLYLKNLTLTSSNELNNLFKSFKFPTKSTKIMTGRMRGQAFVEMENADLAKQALNAMIGIIVKNKPLIIEFGKQEKTAENKSEKVE